MHEYGLTERVVSSAVREAQIHGSTKVLAVNLVVGESAGVLTDSVQMYFDVIAEGTPAEGARLVIKSVPVQMWCEGCGEFFLRPRCAFSCPKCGQDGKPTEKGREFYIESIELE